MKPYWMLVLSALVGTPASASADEAGAAGETVTYNGRLTIAGQPFTGKGGFKFVLVKADGTRLWANNDSEPPIEPGIPSGSVMLPVRDGVYQVRLGDPSLGMARLTPASRLASQVGVWFDDGKHGSSFLGYFSLASAAGGDVATATPGPSTADWDEIRTELRALRAEVAELRRQMNGPKDPPAPAPAVAGPSARTAAKSEVKPALVTLKEVKRHTLGRTDAPLVLVEFTDYECGFCKRFFEQTFPLLKKAYIDTGKLRFVSRNMPATSHARSQPTALALLSAGERTDDDYWKMRAWLFANQHDLSAAALGRYADDAKLDRAAILAGDATRKHGAELQEDLAAAHAAGITGTPSFVLGTSDGQIIRGERIIGAKGWPFFESRIRALLAKEHASVAPIEPASR